MIIQIQGLVPEAGDSGGVCDIALMALDKGLAAERIDQILKIIVIGQIAM